MIPVDFGGILMSDLYAFFTFAISQNRERHSKIEVLQPWASLQCSPCYRFVCLMLPHYYICVTLMNAT
jgi:hypothetical protein